MGKSVYSHAAESGLAGGALLSVVSVCFLLSIGNAFYAFISFAGLLCYPLYLSCGMKKLMGSGGLREGFSSLWLFGIYTVIFSTLIACFVSGVYLVFFAPSFLYDCISQAIETLEKSPAAENNETALLVFRNALDRHMVPTQMEFVVSMGWLSCFSGSLLSLVLAFIVNGSHRRRLTGWGR